MIVVYTGETAPESYASSIFLAGPSPRKPSDRNWREEALKILEEANFNGVVFAPIYRDAKKLDESFDYDAQIEWETKHLNASDIVAFWVPRDLKELPGFTTNVEFGLWVKSGKVLLGSPPDAEKMAYLNWWADKESVETFDDLTKLLKRAVEKLEVGEPRTGGERDVPLHLWKKPEFQTWLWAQKNVGNRLDGAKVVWTFRVGPAKQNTILWALQVNIWVARENRAKTNEVVIFRPNIAAVVVFCRGETILDSEVLLVREFRSATTSYDAMVHELPGGSSPSAQDPQEIVLAELKEETNLEVPPDRLRYLVNRQIASTLCAHSADLFAIEVSPKEMLTMKWMEGSAFGKREDGEITYLEIRKLRDLLQDGGIDWANMGMILQAVWGSSIA